MTRFLTVAFLLAALAVWGFMGGQEAVLEGLRGKSLSDPWRMAEENGRPLVLFSKADSVAAGIRIEELPSTAVPASAIIWLADRAWVYVELASGKFLRMPVAVTKFQQDHYEVGGVSFPARIVTQGAQQLLSKEVGPSIEIGEESQ